MIVYTIDNKLVVDDGGGPANLRRAVASRGITPTGYKDPPFNREIVIDEFISIIWTERFIEYGDVTITLPAVHKNLKFLAPGNVLGCEGSRELMLLETRSIEDGLVTATGMTLEGYFNERQIEPITMVARGGDIMKGVVKFMQERDLISDGSSYIQGLGVADPDPDEHGSTVTEDIPRGPVYDTLVALGKKYNIGQSVVWTKVAGGDHTLVYKTRQGKVLTGQSEDAVRFSPELENFANVKQVTSIAGSKNIALVIVPEWVNPGPGGSTDGGMVWTFDYGDKSAFRNRYIEVDCSDIAEDDQMFEGLNEVDKMKKLYRVITNRQYAALRDHKPTKVVDGEVMPNPQFVYQKDYDLGDTVEVEGEFGEPIHGIVSEYIRSQDDTGERSYPTISAPPAPITGPGA